MLLEMQKFIFWNILDFFVVEHQKHSNIQTLTRQGQSSGRNLPGTIVPWKDILDKW